MLNQFLKYFILFIALLFLKNSIAQGVYTNDSIKAAKFFVRERIGDLNETEKKDSVAKAKVIQEQNKLIYNQKVTDSIANAKVIQKKNKMLNQKVNDSIAQANVIQGQNKIINQKVKDSIAQAKVIQEQNKLIYNQKVTDSITKVKVIQEQKVKDAAGQSNFDPEQYKLLSKRITDDSIAHSNAVNMLRKKITDDSIAQSKANEQQIQLINKRITEGSIASAVSLSSANSIRNIKGRTLVQQPSVTFDVGQVFSKYRFLDNGNKEKDLTTIITYCFNLGYVHPLQNGLFAVANVGMRKGGASLIFEGMNINWNVQYLNANVGVGYMVHKWRVKPYFSASPYFGYMLKGNQINGSSNYDIKKEKSMKATDFGLFLTPGLKVVLSNSISFYAEYKYILGLENIEKSKDEKLFNRGFSINLGIAITIEKFFPATPVARFSK